MAAVSSAAPLLAQLDEEDDALRLHALQSLNSIVHEFWFQIASSIASVEAFYEDEGFTHRELAALVASKVWVVQAPIMLATRIHLSPVALRSLFPSYYRNAFASQMPCRDLS